MEQICKLFLSINYCVYIVAILFVLILNGSIVFQLKHYVFHYVFQLKLIDKYMLTNEE